MKLASVIIFVTILFSSIVASSDLNFENPNLPHIESAEITQVENIYNNVSSNNTIYWDGHAFVSGAVSSIEDDPLAIHVDGSSTTTNQIPFEFGLTSKGYIITSSQVFIRSYFQDLLSPYKFAILNLDSSAIYADDNATIVPGKYGLVYEARNSLSNNLSNHHFGYTNTTFGWVDLLTLPALGDIILHKNTTVRGSLAATGTLCDSVGCIEPSYNISTATTCGEGWERGDVKMSNNTINYPCWKVANGSSGTTDMRDRFVLGAGTFGTGATGGSTSHKHGNSGTTSADISGEFTMYAGDFGVALAGHTHTYTTDTQTTTILPPYFVRVYKECVC